MVDNIASLFNGNIMGRSSDLNDGSLLSLLEMVGARVSMLAIGQFGDPIYGFIVLQIHIAIGAFFFLLHYLVLVISVLLWRFTDVMEDPYPYAART